MASSNQKDVSDRIIPGSFAFLRFSPARDRIEVPATNTVKLGALLVVFFLTALSNGAYAQAPRPKSTASITGTVLDSRGAAIPGVRLTVVSQDSSTAAATSAGTTAAFAFTGLVPGTYRVMTEAAGLEPFASDPFELAAGETRELPIALVRIPVKMTSIDVVATPNEVAKAQVEQQEHQRIVGFLPNFYTSYIWDAAPLTPALKFNLAFRTVTDPAAFVVAAATAAVEHAHGTFPGYGQELQGYGKRYGGTYADSITGKMLGSAIFPTIFRQDPRYFYRGSGSTRSRILYAILQTVVCRGDNGQLEPNYSHVLGSFAAAGFSNLYRAPQDRRASLTIRNGFIVTGGAAITNVMREFLSRKLTPNVPAFANGKP